MKNYNSEGRTEIHNVRFYNLSPRSINCLAYNKKTGKIALSRTDSSIEIWDISFAPFLEKTIPTDSRHSIEGIGWAEDRLFSAGLSGEIIEWDLSSLSQKQSQHVTGNSIWCLDISRDEKIIALGTEEGYLNIFDISDGSLVYRNVFDKQDGRILCCKFDATGEFMVTGSLDVIRIWNTKTGHAIRKMTTGRSEAKKKTIVWSLQVLQDFSIISGDSRGQVTVWDGKIGVQVESHQALVADVLALAVNDNEDMLICSGVEPIIRIFALTTITKGDKISKNWVKFLQRRVHDHDIKALACAGLKVISGGVDGYLGVSSYSKMHQRISKHGPFLQAPCTTVATEARLILLRYCNYVEIWRVGKAQGDSQLIFSDDDKDKRKLLSLDEDPEKILALRSRNDETIVCSTISPDGNWLLYSTKSTIRLFAFEHATRGESPKLNRIKDLPVKEPALRAIFSSDSKSLFLVKYNNHIDIFRIANNDMDFVETIDASKYIKDVIHLVQVSNNCKYFVAAGTCRTIAVWIKTPKQWKHHLNLPKYLVPTTAIALHPDAPKVVASFTDGKFFEYDLDEMRFTCSKDARDQLADNSREHCINNILYDARNENVFILHNDANLIVLHKTETDNDDDDEVELKKTRRTRIDSADEVASVTVKFIKSYEHFVHLAWLSKNEMCAIGVNPVSLIEELPATLKQKKFGAA